MFKATTTILLILLVAGTAWAGKVVDTPQFVMTHLDSSESPTGRALYVLSYDFSTGPMNYHNSSYGAVTFGYGGILPAGAAMIGFGVTDFVAEVYENPGASFSNWASECWVGCTFLDAGVLSYVGFSPLSDNAGPGVFGPATTHFDFAPTDWPMPTADPFNFYLNATWNDGTGLPAGTVIGGTVYAWIESETVANESMTLGEVKTLFR